MNISEPDNPGETDHPVEAVSVSGAGCDRIGFRLLMPHPHLVYEFLLCSRCPMVVVRGTAADFANIDTWSATADRRVRHA
ncbi:MAG: hypothetical protein JXA67_00830 [Micromonosporaceae bacterium]|nr:hypothetical protein [Micromonosporaceae bacterium]